MPSGRPAEEGTPLFFVRLGTALLALAALASFLVSPDRATSAPYATLVIAGTVTVWALLAGRGGRERLVPALRGMVVLSYACVLVLPLMVDWPTDKLPALAPAYRTFPSVLPWAPSWVGTGLSPNQMGGVLAGCLAFAAALLIPWRAGEARDARLRSLRRAAAPLVVLGLPVLAASGSRAALAGFIAAVFAMLVSVSVRVLWAPVAALAAALTAVAVRPDIPGALLQQFLHDEPLQTKLLARVDIWASAVKGIADHPYAGIGLGTLNRVLPVRYPYGVVGLDYTVTQAHNVVLDTALSMGLLGAIGLVLSLVGALWWGFRYGRGDPPPAVTATGARAFTAMLVTFTVFGLTDALGFSSASSLLFWVALAGLLCATHPVPARRSAVEGATKVVS